MNWRKVAFGPVAVLWSWTEIFAHPGHGIGGGSWSLLHYLTEPGHWLQAVLGIVVVALLLRAVTLSNRHTR